MNDQESRDFSIVILLALIGWALFITTGLVIMISPTKVDRINSPPGLVVITPEGKKVFVPDSAITLETK